VPALVEWGKVKTGKKVMLTCFRGWRLMIWSQNRCEYLEDLTRRTSGANQKLFGLSWTGIATRKIAFEVPSAE
jgi:hypothetical protein